MQRLANELKVTVLTDGDIATAMEGMDEYQQMETGRQTYFFIKRLLRDPALRALHGQKKAELQAAGYFERFPIQEVSCSG